MNNTSLLFLEKQKQEWLKKYGLDSKSILSFRAKIKQATKEVQESLGEELLKLISKKSFQDDYEKALELIYRGANIEFKNEKKGDFPLLICARKNYVKTFFALIKAGANVNQTNNYLTTATMASARHGNKEILQTLILLNADINARCLDGDNAIMSAKRHEQVECFQMLVNAQAYLNNQNLQNQTLFDLPGNIEINPFLLEDYSIPEPDPLVLLEEAQLKLIKIKNDR